MARDATTSGPEPPPAHRSFEAVVEQFGAALQRVASAYASDRADAEDLYQDICYAIWKALPAFRGGSRLSTFVWRIAHNRGLSHRARRRRSHEELGSAEEVPDPRPAPDQAAASAFRHARLLAAVRSLSPAQREVVLLSLEGLTGAEIGEVLGLTENAVGVRLNRARHALRQRLDAASMDR